MEEGSARAERFEDARGRCFVVGRSGTVYCRSNDCRNSRYAPRKAFFRMCVCFFIFNGTVTVVDSDGSRAVEALVGSRLEKDEALAKSAGNTQRNSG